MLFAKIMRWDKKIEDPADVKNKIRAGQPPAKIFLICKTKSGRIEIMSCKQAVSPINKPEELVILAAAKGKQRSFELLAELYEDGILK